MLQTMMIWQTGRWSRCSTRRYTGCATGLSSRREGPLKAMPKGTGGFGTSCRRCLVTTGTYIGKASGRATSTGSGLPTTARRRHMRCCAGLRKGFRSNPHTGCGLTCCERAGGGAAISLGAPRTGTPARDAARTGTSARRPCRFPRPLSHRPEPLHCAPTCIRHPAAGRPAQSRFAPRPPGRRTQDGAPPPPAAPADSLY